MYTKYLRSVLRFVFLKEQEGDAKLYETSFSISNFQTITLNINEEIYKKFL